MRRVVVLRPEPGATASCDAARDLGLEPVAIPLFQIEQVAWRAPEQTQFEGLLVTSANALRHGGEELRSLRGMPVYAVGEATAAEARGHGFQIKSVGKGGVDDLLGSIEPDLRLLHLCGAERREPNAPRQPITTLQVYRASELPAPNLSPIAGAVVAVHSPRAGARLAALAAEIETSHTSIAAISKEAARAAAGDWEDVAIADEPSDAALLALAARLCKTSQR